MRPLALVLVAALSLPAWGADDAPVLLQPGDPAPVAGVLLPDALAVRRAAELEGLRAETASLKEDAGKPNVLVLVLVGVAGVLVGGAVGYGVAKATAPKP